MADKKISPRFLGIGLARNAGEALSGRQAQLEQQLREAEGEQKKKRKLSESLGIKSD